MARKKAKNSGGTGILIVFALAFSALAAIPKNAWIAVGVIAGIGTIMWLLAERGKRRLSQLQASAAKNTHPQKPQGLGVTFSMREVSTSNKDIEESPDFYTVQLGSPAANTFKIPSISSQKADARWVPAGEVVEVAGFSLPGGMFYMGNTLGSSHDAQEPSLINPKLRIAKNYVDLNERLMSYWPSFHSITPQARRGYLQWLAGGRNDPLADTGYVFLFFYGLERRALIDPIYDSKVNNEVPLIVDEVRRLLSIYRGNGSFRGYAEGFLDYLGNRAVDANLYLGLPPSVAEHSYEMPLPLRIGLGQHASNKHPLNADWALAWAMADPNISKRTPVIRCKDVFSRLFKLKYENAYPAGLTLAQNKTKLKASYRPASAVIKTPTLTLGDLPDVMATSGTRKILQLLVEQCTSEVEPYSRFLGRNPESAEALEALLQLPVPLWPKAAHDELDELQSRIGDDLIVMSFGELAGRFKSAGALSRDKVIALARALESLRIGMEPDVLGGSKTPKAEDRIALFVTQPEDGSLRASAAYNAASVTLDLASAVASADGDTSNEEITLLAQHIDSWSHLSGAHRKRLKAHLQIQLQQPPTLASLKKKLDPLPVDAKRTIAGFLAHLAQADGIVSPAEVKLLERVYKALQLDSQLLYSDLHGAAAGVGIAVTPASNDPSAEPGARPASSSKLGFVLDHDRIAQLQRETAEVSALLAKVFTEDQVEEAERPTESAEPNSESSADVPGLDLEHSAFLRLLISRPEWSRAELETAASDMELMLDGALEQINDMAFERFDMPVTEGDDPVEINTDILEELAL
ncbi:MULTISPECIES: TerB N-terminal domain-containing protein [Pseudomonas]|uniref:Tellurite resistance protein TerB n=1 Tax=Pseudomonas fluorescens LMG 5329 TaxID=1324332 RepID=A0A0A1YRS1_PSEFL|nr:MULTISPECIES: TerB N-terminal domain-containing protein [Pseudomonas]KGE64073.1 Tellurite resistance protein TerB [Pseudomonas fluorescens LMG 5329]NWE00698.1 TerB N-terminal domain-containing protein [Pseudomonas sp. IPO3749]NWF24318.1 TerB N-terminal domain-containing protein [Pseudomonas sp. IPO3749]